MLNLTPPHTPLSYTLTSHHSHAHTLYHTQNLANLAQLSRQQQYGGGGRRPSLVAGGMRRPTASFDRGDSGTSSKEVDRQESATSLASDVSPMSGEAPGADGAGGAGAGAGAGGEAETGEGAGGEAGAGVAGAGASTTPRGSKKSSSVHPVDF